MIDDLGVVSLDLPLTPSNLFEAYRNGVFPWPMDDEVPWCCPDPRAILEFSRLEEALKQSRSHRRLLKFADAHWTSSQNEAFPEVMKLCASVRRPKGGGTWIIPEMLEAYGTLHQTGHALSVEVWSKDRRLVGGVYGVFVEGLFSAESMFYLESGASKYALVVLARLLRNRGLKWMDIQMLSPHLESLGAQEVSRKNFLKLLEGSRIPGPNPFTGQ
jgi:leucyl/phenylalanyl-tRNA--protein transferase